MKVLGIILGVLLVVGGVYCAMTPVATFATLGWVIGFAMVAEGIGSVLTWNERRRLGFADGWTLAGAILSIVLGLVVLCSGAMQLALDAMLAYLVAFWLIVGGIVRIVGAFGLRDVHKTGATLGKNWGLVLAMGILVVIAGVFCLFHPLLTMASVGMLMGIGIASSGCSLVVGSLTA